MRSARLALSGDEDENENENENENADDVAAEVENKKHFLIASDKTQHT